jgi:competence protein ComEA
MVLLLFFCITGGLYLYSAYPMKEDTLVQGIVNQTANQELESTSESTVLKATDSEQITSMPDDMKEAAIPDEKANVIYVHVCGSVVTPGVYEFTQRARVIDAITKADGFRSGAAEDAINQAQLLIDGQRLYIPSREEIEAGTVTVDLMSGGDLNQEIDSNQETNGLINLNQASKQELMTLPGIGESKANSIISYRNEHYGFQSIEDIQKIPGIKEAIFQKVKNYITVSR